jgi:response regulator RpfG family c-di-GMP phosphodiesterase
VKPEVKPMRILAVDDDLTSLTLLTRVLAGGQGWDVKAAGDAREGLRLAREFKPDLIISDYYMPEIDGFEFCRQVKEDPALQSILFMLLTGETEVSKKVSGLDQGADDYMEKPFSAHLLVSKVKALLRIKSLQDELRGEKEELSRAKERLEKDLEESISLLLRILEARIPGAGDRARMARGIAEYMGQRLSLDEEEKKNIVFGALLHEVGKVGLPDGIIERDARSLLPGDRRIFDQYPVIGAMLVSAISGFKASAHDIQHQLENYDGTGTPERLRGDEIPLGAKILRAIVFLEDFLKTSIPAGEIVRQVKLSISRTLDPKVAVHLEAFLAEKDNSFSSDRQKLRLEELKPGMVVADDVYTLSGFKLLSRGFRLEEKILQLLVDHSCTDPILGGVYVYCGKISE